MTIASPNPDSPSGLGLENTKYQHERQKDDSSDEYVGIQSTVYQSVKIKAKFHSI
jgi:hypothetical protein